MTDRLKPEQLGHLDRVTATFQPLRTDDLQEHAKPWVGVRAQWSAVWVIEEGAYTGDWAMMCMDHRPDLPPFGWVPLCDLNLGANG